MLKHTAAENAIHSALTIFNDSKQAANGASSDMSQAMYFGLEQFWYWHSSK